MAIAQETCIGVMNGAGTAERYLLRSLFFESLDRQCKLVGSFSEVSDEANAYRGELLGLMALHLILLAVNKINPNLDGSVTLHSDCLSALS